MNKLKLMTILGTRPEIIRLSSIIKKCDQSFEHILVHTGQNYSFELSEIFFDDLGIRKPDYYLKVVGKDLGETMGNIISASYKLIEKINPDAILILGDTNSTLSAISAKRLKCPIFHMEAGNRCWDWNVSEMVNRKIVDHIADVNLPYTEHARRYLLSEGLDGKNIFVTGSPMKEVIRDHSDAIEKSTILRDLGLKKANYIVVSCHREENVDNKETFCDITNSINDMAAKFNVPIIFSTHPRTLTAIIDRKTSFNSLVRNIKPLSFTDYNNLQKNAMFVLSDSGTLVEESAILNFPSILMRTSTERPEGMEKGRTIIGGTKSHDVMQAINLALSLDQTNENRKLPADYLDIDVSETIVKIIQSYTHIINKTVWQKNLTTDKNHS